MAAVSVRSVSKQEYWRKLFAEQASSRLSVVQFCKMRGVSKPSFYAWRKKLAESPSLGKLEPPAFAQVAVLPNMFVDGSANSSPSITIQMPNEVRIEVPPGADRRLLREVLAALQEASC